MKKISIGGMVLSSLLLTACGQVSSVPLKDGDYTQKQDYKAEDYTFYINVNTALKDGKIVTMNVAGDPKGPTAVKFAQEFKNGMQEKVVGKTLDEAKKIAYVSGASLTSKAFSEALDAIATQASSK